MGLSHGPLNYDTERLNSLSFNPTDQSKSSDFYTSQLDPDGNFSFFSTSSNYFVEEEINAKISTEHFNPKFSVLHLNARSLIGNVDKFKFLLDRLQKPFSAIAVSETWLSDLSADQVNIPGYAFISNHSATKSGGGTGLYLQDNLDYKICSDCNVSDPDVIETLFVEISVPHGKNIIVGVIYRPPNHHLTDLMEKFTDIVTKISRSDKCCYLTGDLIWTSSDTPTTNLLKNLLIVCSDRQTNSYSCTLGHFN